MESEGELITIAFIIFIFFCLFSPTGTEKKTIYFLYCSDLKHDIYSCPKDSYITVTKHSFKTNFEKQLLVSDGFFVASSCTIFDKNNWKCDKESMRDGNYWDTYYLRNSVDKDEKESYIPVYYQVSWFKYWIVYLKGILK